MAPRKAAKKVAKKVTVRRPTRRVSAKVMRKANRKRPASGLEKEIHALLKELQIPFVKEKTIGRCHADIFIEPRTVIELNGCYWHGCVKCTKAFSKMQLTAKAKDAKRYAFFQRLGFSVYVIWECQLKQDPEKVREQLWKIYNAA
jgi:G:T-mismatch repair DNA endonuclease (very short patch repair protein)